MKLRSILFAVAAAIVVLCLAPPAWFQAKSIFANWQEVERARAATARMARVREWNRRPPALLPERSGDRNRYPRQSFVVSYIDGNGFAIDTAVGTVTYDRIVDPDTTIAMRLTTAQLDTLYKAALLDRLFDMPQPWRIPSQWAGAEHWGGDLTVGAGSVRHALRRDSWGGTEPWTDDHKRLQAFVAELRRMVEASPVYRALPRPRGNYID